MKAQYRTTVTFNQEDNDFLTNLAKRLGASKTEVMRRGLKLLAKSEPTETMTEHQPVKRLFTADGECVGLEPRSSELNDITNAFKALYTEALNAIESEAIKGQHQEPNGLDERGLS